MPVIASDAGLVHARRLVSAMLERESQAREAAGIKPPMPHIPIRPVQDAVFFYSSVPGEFTNSRLVGRSVWNSGWKIVIPAKTLHSNTQDGLNRFVASVKDIELFLRTYSHSGN